MSPTYRCKRCNQYFTVQPGNTDVIHTCKGNTTLSQEDILKLDDTHWNLLGIPNKASIQAQIEGVKVPQITRRGINSDTHRTRAHFEFIELKDNKMSGGN